MYVILIKMHSLFLLSLFDQNRRYIWATFNSRNAKADESDKRSDAYMIDDLHFRTIVKKI